MRDPVTVDASVFVNAFSPTEAGSDKSWGYIGQLKGEGVGIIVPALLLSEIAAAVARKQNNTAQALLLVEEICNLSNLTLIAVDESLARLAAEIAATHRLRGSDAVYAAVALRFGTNLVTLDREQQERLKNVLPVGSP